jgi:hypothetical protein
MQKEHTCKACGRSIERKNGWCLPCERRLLRMARRIEKAEQDARRSRPGRVAVRQVQLYAR